MNIQEQQYTPLITIVVAVFNGAKTLKQCIDSVINQSYQNKEIIIMDGGSTDDTVNILVNNSHQITYWETNKDRGIAHAWNKALKRCCGEWILFLGADDALHDKEVLADIAKILESNKTSDIVYGQIIFGNGALIGEKLGQPFIWSTQKRRMLIPHTGCFQRRKLFSEIGDFDESFKIAVDYEMLLRKPLIKAEFFPRLITTMGGEGISSKQTVRSLKENRMAQIKNKVDFRVNIEIWHAIYQFRNAITK